MWAFTRKPGPQTIRDSSGLVDPATILEIPDFLRKTNQLGEMRMLARPADDEIEELRQLAYRPEATEEVGNSRLAWEETYTGLLAGTAWTSGTISLSRRAGGTRRVRS